MRERKVYHYEQKNRAGVRAALYAVVAVYIGYLGYRTTPLYAEPDGLSVTMAWALGAVLMLCAVGVLIYTWRRYKRELAAAEYTEEEYAELERREREKDGE